MTTKVSIELSRFLNIFFLNKSNKITATIFTKLILRKLGPILCKFIHLLQEIIIATIHTQPHFTRDKGSCQLPVVTMSAVVTGGEGVVVATGEGVVV